MSWQEFCTLLSGIMPKTPLGQIVSIRSEEDKDILKHFTREQLNIRSDWRNRIRTQQANSISKEQYENEMQKLQSIFAKMFS